MNEGLQNDEGAQEAAMAMSDGLGAETGLAASQESTPLKEQPPEASLDDETGRKLVREKLEELEHDTGIAFDAARALSSPKNSIDGIVVPEQPRQQQLEGGASIESPRPEIAAQEKKGRPKHGQKRKKRRPAAKLQQQMDKDLEAAAAAEPSPSEPEQASAPQEEVPISPQKTSSEEQPPMTEEEHAGQQVETNADALVQYQEVRERYRAEIGKLEQAKQQYYAAVAKYEEARGLGNFLSKSFGGERAKELAAAEQDYNEILNTLPQLRDERLKAFREARFKEHETKAGAHEVRAERMTMKVAAWYETKLDALAEAHIHDVEELKAPSYDKERIRGQIWESIKARAAWWVRQPLHRKALISAGIAIPIAGFSAAWFGAGLGAAAGVAAGAGLRRVVGTVAGGTVGRWAGKEVSERFGKRAERKEDEERKEQVAKSSVRESMRARMERPANAAGENAPAAHTQDGIPFMITKKMRAELAARGMSEEEIHKLAPEQAWEKLKSETRAIEGKEEDAASETAEVKPSDFLKERERIKRRVRRRKFTGTMAGAAVAGATGYLAGAGTAVAAENLTASGAGGYFMADKPSVTADAPEAAPPPAALAEAPVPEEMPEPVEAPAAPSADSPAVEAEPPTPTPSEKTAEISDLYGALMDEPAPPSDGPVSPIGGIIPPGGDGLEAGEVPLMPDEIEDALVEDAVVVEPTPNLDDLQHVSGVPDRPIETGMDIVHDAPDRPIDTALESPGGIVVEIKAGDNLWNRIAEKLEQGDLIKSKAEIDALKTAGGDWETALAHRNRLINELKDHFAVMSQDQLKAIGFRPGPDGTVSIDRIYPGNKLDLTGVLGDYETFTDAVSDADKITFGIEPSSESLVPAGAAPEVAPDGAATAPDALRLRAADFGDYPAAERVTKNLEELAEKYADTYPDYRGVKTLGAFKSVWHEMAEQGNVSKHMLGRYPHLQSSWGPLSHVTVKDLYDASEGVSYSIDGTPMQLLPETEMELRNLIEHTRSLPGADELYEAAKKNGSSTGMYMSELAEKLDQQQTPAPDVIAPESAAGTGSVKGAAAPESGAAPQEHPQAARPRATIPEKTPGPRPGVYERRAGAFKGTVGVGGEQPIDDGSVVGGMKLDYEFGGYAYKEVVLGRAPEDPRLVGWAERDIANKFLKHHSDWVSYEGTAAELFNADPEYARAVRKMTTQIEMHMKMKVPGYQNTLEPVRLTLTDEDWAQEPEDLLLKLEKHLKAVKKGFNPDGSGGRWTGKEKLLDRTWHW